MADEPPGASPSPPPEAGPARWLAVVCGGQGLLLPLQGAGEIFELGELLPVPRTRPWFAGVTRLRGSLHGVVDLAGFLGLPPPVELPAEPPRLLALHPSLSSPCALRLDALAGLRAESQMNPEPEDGVPRRPYVLGRWRDGEGHVWQEIDLAALASNEAFLDIAEPAG